MASSVRENEQTPPEENSEDLSLKDSKSVLSSSEGSESDDVEQMVSEGPTGENGATTVAEGSTSEYVAATVGEDPTSEIVATTIGEGIVSEKVVGVVGEGPVSETAIVAVGEGPISRLDDSLSEGRVKDSPVKVDEGPCNNSTVKDGETPLNKSIVLVGDGSVSNSIVNVGEGTVSNSVVRVPPEKRSLYKFGQRTSNFRGVTRHRWTGKYEAHLWDNSTITEGRKRKGKQVYLGGYESETKAAQAYDLAALKYWGASANTKLNFPISTYEKELEEMKDMSREEYVNSLRRKSICFTRGHSIYRGVTRQNEGRRWQARIGRVAGGKDIYLGTYDTEEEAAEAYDIAAVKLRGMNAITNFDISNYYKEGTKELDVIPIKTVEEESSPLRIRYFKLE